MPVHKKRGCDWVHRMSLLLSAHAWQFNPRASAYLHRHESESDVLHRCRQQTGTLRRPGCISLVRERLGLAFADRLFDERFQLAPDLLGNLALPLAQQCLLLSQFTLLFAELAHLLGGRALLQTALRLEL